MPEPIRESGQDYRRGITTDARIAIITLDACEQPRLDLAAGPVDPQPSRFVRGFRRFTLTARNHFIRDNWFWRGFEAVRLSYSAAAARDASAAAKRFTSSAGRRKAMPTRPPASVTTPQMRKPNA